MPEEQKKESCASGSKGLIMVGKILLGIVLIALGVLLCIRWLLALQVLIRACLGPMLILIGIVFIAIAKE